jgi:hypothetical protein
MTIDDLSIEPECDLHSQMTNCERFVLVGLLKRLEPGLSLEVGTYMGGSLQLLSKYSKKVISIDIDPTVASRLGERFPNVAFQSGDSRTLLPSIIARINQEEADLGFVLIDGDHSTDGVRRDIESVLRLVPRRPIVVIMHDSFNPSCRAGMRLADWSASPYVHEVELDFVSGVFFSEAADQAAAKSMWGGFACALLEPERRTGALPVLESRQAMFEAVRRVSEQAPDSVFRGIMRRLRRLVS